jgi:ribose 5-phosphate isomerase B
MRVSVGADHGGFVLKEMLKQALSGDGHEILDVGVFDPSPSDYPDQALAVAEAVVGGTADRGVLVCGSGVGACVAANKVAGVRAATIHDTFSAHQGVEDDDVNVACLGARVIGPELALEVVRTFLQARFSGEARHVRRLAKVTAIEGRQAQGQE